MHKKNIVCVVTCVLLFLLMQISFSVAINDDVFMKYQDIKEHWAKEWIVGLIEDDVVSGFKLEDESYKIKPDDYITRAEIVALLLNSIDLKEENDEIMNIGFIDLDDTMWYWDIMVRAFDNNIITGYEDGTLRPDGHVSRAELVTLVKKAFGFTWENDKYNVEYKDVDKDAWFYQNVVTVSSNRILSGYPDGSFLPYNKATRAEVMVVIQNSREKMIGYESEELINDPNGKKEDYKNDNFDGVNEEVEKQEDAEMKEELDTKEVEEKQEDSEKQDEKEKQEEEKKEEEKQEAEEAIEKELAKDDEYEQDKDKEAENKKDENKKEELKAETDVSEEIKDEKEQEGEKQELENPFKKMKPEIVIRSPFVFGQSEIETDEDEKKVQIRVFANTVVAVDYYVHNLPGDGDENKIYESRRPRIIEIKEDGFTETLYLELDIPEIKDGLNIVRVYVEDVYGNKADKEFRFLRLIDSNNDGISNYHKRLMGLLVDKIDTDGDGLTDFEEVVIFNNRLSPLRYSSVGNGVYDSALDFDGDGLSNIDELRVYGTDPTNPDTDGDGLPDGVEIYEYGIDPTNPDSLGNGKTDFENVISRKIQNIKKAKSDIVLPKNRLGVIDPLAEVDFDSEPVSRHDERTDIVLRVQLLMNTVLNDLNRSEYSFKYTGEFNIDVQGILYDFFGALEVDNELLIKIIRFFESIEVKDEYHDGQEYLGYDLNREYNGVIYIKMLLEKWRELNAPIFTALYTVPTLYENDGSFSGVFDALTVAHLKLFQEHNALKATGRVNDATMKVLLDSVDNWEIDKTLIKDEMFLQDSFGENNFFRYQSDGKSPLDPVYYGQTYGIWHQNPYYAVRRGVEQRNRTIATSGCGPAAMAMIVATLADSDVDPGVVANISMENDFMTASSGTEGRLYPFVCDMYNLKHEYSSNISYVKTHLKRGNYLAIASVGRGNFTTGGHLITLVGTIRLPGENFERIVVFDPDIGNQNYIVGDDIVLSREPGVVYVKPDVLQKEMAIGFWLVWE